MTVPSIHRREMRRRLVLPTPTEVLPAEVRDDLDAATDCDAYAAELLESGEYLGAAEALGAGDLWRVLAVVSLVRWLGSSPTHRCIRCGRAETPRHLTMGGAPCSSCGGVLVRGVDVEIDEEPGYDGGRDG